MSYSFRNIKAINLICQQPSAQLIVTLIAGVAQRDFPENCERKGKSLAKFISTVEPCNADTIGTTTVCPEYGGVHISESSGKFLVSVAMQIHAVECWKTTFKSSPLLYVGEKG